MISSGGGRALLGQHLSPVGLTRERLAARPSPPGAHISSSDKSLPEPANSNHTTAIQDQLDQRGAAHDTVPLPALARGGPAHRDPASGCRPVNVGGHLLVVSHAAPPPWIDLGEHPGHRFVSPAQEFVKLALGEREWLVITAETRTCSASSPSGEPEELVVGVLLLQRRRA